MSVFKKCLFLLLASLQLSLAHAEDKKVYRMAITDLEGIEQVQREFGPFRDRVAELSGLQIEFFPISNRTIAVEAMRSKKLDFVLTGPAEYVIFRSRIDAVPVAGFARPDYFSCIITLTDSGISSIEGLKGKKIAMGDIGSTSKHLAPMQMLKDAALDPRRDVKPVHTSMRLGWEGLKRGNVDAFATTNNKFMTLRGAEKELEAGTFRVIARGGDLPNDVLVAGSHVSPAAVESMRQAFGEHSKELIAALLQGADNQKYKGMKFVTTVSDSDYNPIRTMYATAGYKQFSKFID